MSANDCNASFAMEICVDTPQALVHSNKVVIIIVSRMKIILNVYLPSCLDVECLVRERSIKGHTPRHVSIVSARLIKVTELAPVL